MKIKKQIVSILASAMLASSMTVSVFAENYADNTATPISYTVKAVDSYINWDGTSNVAQFIGPDGVFYFAYDNGNYVTVVPTNGIDISGTILNLKKQHSLFGNVICDSQGYFYVATGETNTDPTDTVDTVFITKYDKNGNVIATAGDTGGSSLGFNNRDFLTKSPFRSGNCSMAINGNIVVIDYSRSMYSGHQSNSVFAVNTTSMEKVFIGDDYSSHSFGQRIVPYKNGFFKVSEGDCYDRAFTVHQLSENRSYYSYNIFDFWVERGAFDQYDMYKINNNFAHIGGVAAFEDGIGALVGTSVPSLSESAMTESEQLFIQIFRIDSDLNDPSSYLTTGIRSGVAGNNGDKDVINYGVKWLTNSSYEKISQPQVVSTPNEIVILYEVTAGSSYKGVYCTILDKDGCVLNEPFCAAPYGKLNSCQMPVYSNNYIYWAGNGSNDSYIHIYRLNVDGDSIAENMTVTECINYVNNCIQKKSGTDLFMLTDTEFAVIDKVISSDNY